MKSRTIKSSVVAVVMSVCVTSMQAMVPGTMMDSMGQGTLRSSAPAQPVSQPQQPITMWNGATSGKQYKPATPAMKWMTGGAIAAGALWIARKAITKR